jgi:starch synthase
MEKYHQLFHKLAPSTKGRASFNITFDDTMAHRIEAGSDMFLMPSRYEPCGLNQLISLRYGTVPIVRATGGLKDTIADATPEAMASGSANGFSFESYDSEELLATVKRAIGVFTGSPADWRKIRAAGMAQDWSWDHSASAYVKLYEETLEKARAVAPGV